jgi:hypothetical protein
LRPGPTVYGECSFRLKDSSVTSVTLQNAYLGGGVIPPPSASGRRGTTLQPPQGAERIAHSPQGRYKGRISGTSVYRPRRLGDAGAPHCSLPKGRKRYLSHLSDDTKGVSRGRGYTAPVGSGTAGRDIAAAPGCGTVSRGATNLVGQTAGLCGPGTLQGIEPDQLPRTDNKKDHARRGKRPTTTKIRT